MPRDRIERKLLLTKVALVPSVPLMSPPFTISDLRQRPEFFDTVAERIWQAWWKADGHPLDYISGRLRENMNAPRRYRLRWSPMTANRFLAPPR